MGGAASMREHRLFRRTDTLKCPWRDAEFAVVDLETTGLDLARDTIVSYGAVVVRHGRIVTSESLYGLVHPECDIRPEAVAVHALREADVADAPPLSEAVGTLRDLLTDRVLVAHAAWVDTAFLSRAFRDNGLKFRPAVVDTAALARALGAAPRQHRHEPNLEWLADTLGLPVVDPHHALGDAVTTAQVFLALASRLERIGYDTARSLVDLSAGDGRLGRG
ncbi:MAG: 3'-5' exonuclease [Rhodococcus sp. (in: high G+C Gram-positive bacteria)]|nr:MAG: 3'-5' exonuclease [Rhodococcus sp. (in: high G+C Gram-positive bacteria)]